ncbi:hypothetical protein [Shewanella marisflavi]|uniref:hypothetical protein n=1 Tax=Shewanella marisflavi TaxID=260364 RepID=UPI003AAA5BF2
MNKHTHPVAMLFEHLTHIAATGEEEYQHSNRPCSLCFRTPDEYGSRSIEITNAYNEAQNLCPCCHSFFISNIDALGIESEKRPNTSQKFGMWSGVGCLIQANAPAILFAPKGVIDKLPHPFGANVIETTSTKQITWIVNNIESLAFPLLWVNDFGRKTHSLIANLRYSTPNEMHPCSDDEHNSTTLPLRIIDIERIQKIVTMLAEHAQSKGFITTVTRLAQGVITPLDGAKFFKKYPELKPVLDLLPVDPHQRQKLLSVASKLV